MPPRFRHGILGGMGATKEVSVELTEAVDLARVRGLTRSGAARSIRLGAGLSYGDTARAIDVSRTTILRWERCDRVPRGEKALAYLELLDRLMAR